MKKEHISIIMAAGEGKRFKSLLPKVLHPLCGTPMVEMVAQAAAAAGAARVIVVVGVGADRVKEKLSASALDPGPEFALQAEQKGTGDAVNSAADLIDPDGPPVVILSGDAPLIRPESIAGLVEGLEANDAAVCFYSFVPQNPFGLGRVLRDEAGDVRCIIEEKDADAGQKKIGEVNSGVYCVRPKFLIEALGRLKNDNAQGEYYLTDIIGIALAGGHKVAGVIGDDPLEFSGINNRAQLADAEVEVLRRRRTELMESGVTMHLPETIYLDQSAVIEPDVTIYPGAVITGASVIRSGASIGPGAVIHDSEVDSGARILAYCSLQEAVVGPECSVGPFGRLRPGAKLERKAKVGNFVEVKNSIIHAGAKASHLTYVGDAEVGERANLGAGTITCNYDGFNKHRTFIGADAFIGSNTALVAPVKIADGAFVGAGSTITKDVGTDELGVTRIKQKNIPGFGRLMRARNKKKENK